MYIYEVWLTVGDILCDNIAQHLSQRLKNNFNFTCESKGVFGFK